MELEIKAFNEVLTIYYELLEVVGTTPSIWGSQDFAIKQFPLDIEFIVDVQSIIKKLTKQEDWLINEYFFFQGFLDGVQKIQFNSIQVRVGKLFIEKQLYPISLYGNNRRFT